MTTLKLKKLVGQDTIDLINLRREQHLKSQIERAYRIDNDGNATIPHKQTSLVRNLAKDMAITSNAITFYEFFDTDKKEWIRCRTCLILGVNSIIRRNPTEEQILKYGLSQFDNSRWTSL